MKTLEELLRKLPMVDISHQQIIQRYAEIDAFSLGKDKAQFLQSGQTARVMGKNDLWIAATASVLNAALLAIDHDFDSIDASKSSHSHRASARWKNTPRYLEPFQRFLRKTQKTVETVLSLVSGAGTGLKPGVNERTLEVKLTSIIYLA